MAGSACIASVGAPSSFTSTWNGTRPSLKMASDAIEYAAMCFCRPMATKVSDFHLPLRSFFFHVPVGSKSGFAWRMARLRFHFFSTSARFAFAADRMVPSRNSATGLRAPDVSVCAMRHVSRGRMLASAGFVVDMVGRGLWGAQRGIVPTWVGGGGEKENAVWRVASSCR